MQTIKPEGVNNMPKKCSVNSCAYCRCQYRHQKPGVCIEQHPTKNEDQSDLPEYIRLSARFAYETEEKRGAGLEQLSTKLLECITILSVALLTPAAPLFEYYRFGSPCTTTQQIRLVWMYAIVFTLLILALCLVLYSQTKRKMLLPPSPTDFLPSYDHMNAKEAELNDRFSAFTLSRMYAEILGEHCDGMKGKHEKMWELIRASMHLIISACILIGLFAAYLILEFL